MRTALICKNCGELKEIHAKGMCYKCYRKVSWKSKKTICDRCKREMPHHAKGLCPGCYNFVFKLEEVKKSNHKKYHNIDPELYSKVTTSCVICGFDKIVELHHLDENKKNNSESNLVGLCPNHHKMFHNYYYKTEIINELEKKGYFVPKNEKIGFIFKGKTPNKKW